MNTRGLASDKYEAVATQILNELAIHFGLDRVEGKQSTPGRHSTTRWKIDAKGILKGDEAFVVIECRLYPKSKLTQEAVAAIAYRIMDTRAVGGITVTPLELQKGAKLIAANNRILSVQLNADATPQEFALKFLNKLFVRPLGVMARCEVGELKPEISCD